MAVTAPARPFPPLRIRGRSFMALVLTPQTPLDAWLAGLDAQLARSPAVLAGRPVVLDVSAVPPGTAGADGLVDALQERGIRLLGVEGTDAGWDDAGPWRRLPMLSGGRTVLELAQPAPDTAPDATAPDAADAARPAPDPTDTPDAPAPATMPAAAAEPEPTSLVLTEPVRSGQSIVFPGGDVTIVGSVASGAEVFAGGSIHVYGTLRGRAIAGYTGNAAARIFCRKLEAELLAIDGLYRTADGMEPVLRGRAVQAWLDGDTLMMAVVG